MVRFEDASEVVSKCWSLVLIFTAEDPEEVAEGATGRSIFSAVMKTLSNFDIPVASIVGFGCDGCTTMIYYEMPMSLRHIYVPLKPVRNCPTMCNN